MVKMYLCVAVSCNSRYRGPVTYATRLRTSHLILTAKGVPDMNKQRSSDGKVKDD